MELKCNFEDTSAPFGLYHVLGLEGIEFVLGSCHPWALQDGW